MKRLLILLLFPLMMFAQDSTLVGDVDCSGEVNSQDASLILQFVTNVIDSLPCEANMTGLTPDQLQEMIDMMEDQLSINYTAGSGGGCNFRFPEGLDGDAITHDLINFNDYVVPDGKKLYILQHYAPDATGRIRIDGLPIKASGNTDSYQYTLANPIVASSGQVITNGEDSQSVFNGIIVEENNDVQAITHDLINFNDYVVPAGKKLYILQHYAPDAIGRIRIDGLPIKASGNTDSYQYTLANPIVASSGQVITNGEDSQSVFNGYLVDEDYFADCSGGGGSSSIGNGTENENTQNEDGSIIGSVVDQSEVSGARIFYLENYNIIESDENGTFVNTLYDGDKNVYQFFLEKETQTLYWMEALSTSAQSGVFKKSSLSNFNPVNIGYFSGNIYDFRNIYATQDGVFYYTRDNYVYKIENNITELFLIYSVQGGVFDFSIDNDGNYFYTSYNNINSSSLTDPIFSGGSGSYTQLEIILDDENAKVYCLDLADGRIFSTDYSGNDYTEYLPTSWSQQIANQNLSAFDVVLENNIPTFFVQFESTIIKCTNENDTQVISSFDINNSYYQYYEVFALNNDLIINNDNNSEENLSSNYKLFYLENYNIIESDENGTFINTFYDGDKNVYQFFLEKETQTLYWMEALSTSAQSGVFKKSSLSNFNPINIGYFSGNINDFRNIYATQDGVFYYTRDNYVYKIENNITEIFLSTGVSGGVFDFSIDNDGNYFYTSYNNINSSSLTDPIFSGGSGSYTQFEIILDDENAKVYCLDLADGRIFSTDYSGNDYTEYLPTSWSQQIANQNLSAFDVVLENNIPTFFVQFESTIIKCTNENDTQVISSFDINNSYYQYNEVFITPSND